MADEQALSSNGTQKDTYYGVGYTYQPTQQGLKIVFLAPEAKAQGVLRLGDIITSVKINGAYRPTTDDGIAISGLRGTECTPVEFKRLRDGVEQEVYMDRSKFHTVEFPGKKAIQTQHDPDAPECNATMSWNGTDGFENGLPWQAAMGRIRS